MTRINFRKFRDNPTVSLFDTMSQFNSCLFVCLSLCLSVCLTIRAAVLSVLFSEFENNLVSSVLVGELLCINHDVSQFTLHAAET